MLAARQPPSLAGKSRIRRIFSPRTFLERTAIRWCRSRSRPFADPSISGGNWDLAALETCRVLHVREFRNQGVTREDSSRTPRSESGLGRPLEDEVPQLRRSGPCPKRRHSRGARVIPRDVIAAVEGMTINGHGSRALRGRACLALPGIG